MASAQQADALLQEGARLSAAGQHHNAEIKYLASISAHPTFRAYHAAAQAQCHQGRYKDALLTLQTAENIIPQIKANSARLKAHETYLELKLQTLEKLGLHDEARKEMEKAANHPDSDISLKYKEKLSALQQTEEPSVLQEFIKACSFGVNDVPHWQVIPMSWLNRWSDHCKGLGEAPGPVSTIELTEELEADQYFIDGSKQLDMKVGLEEEKDYKLVPYNAGRLLNKAFGSEGPSLIRRTIKLSESVSQVEVYLFRVKVIVMPQATLSPLPVKILQISRKFTIEQAKMKVCRIIEADFNTAHFKLNEARYWKLDASTDLQALKRLPPKPKPAVQGGKQLKADCLLEDAGFATGDILMLEFQRQNANWPFLSELEAANACEVCKSHIDLKLCAACKKVQYCSKKCQAQHFPTHKKECKKPRDQAPLQNALPLSRAIVGLRNLGNTCFMNSALQCLIFTEPLTQYILSGRYRDELNVKNPIGTGGNLAVAYAEFLREVKSSNKAVIPSFLKRVIEKFAPQFSGFNQHDSQELLSYVLDGLHEDLNQVFDKPYLEPLEFGSDTSHEVAAQQSWENHLKRNKSVIVDLMHGQYKSTLVCPNCSRVSVTYDPFLTFSLQIPSKESRRQIVYFKALDASKLPIEITADLIMSSRLEALRGLVAGVTQTANFIWAAVSNNTIRSFPSDSKELSDVKFSSLFAFETPLDRTDFLTLQVRVTREADKKARMDVECAYTHLVFPYREDTLVALHLLVLRQFKAMLEKNVNGPVEESEEQLRSHLPSAYRVLVVKPHSSKSKEPCPLCGKKSCKSCELPITTETTVLALLTLLKVSADDLMLEIEWSSRIKDYKLFGLCTRYEQLLKSPGLVSSDNITLFDCLRQSALPEKLDRDNTWYCNMCKEHVEATKTYQLYKLPDVLVIALKRFKSRGLWNEKLNAFVEFPVEGLDLTEYVLGSHERPLIYDLYAVSNHYGGMGGGHYTAFVKWQEDGQWYEMDDGSVSSAGRVVTPAAYILFYRRRQ